MKKKRTYTEEQKLKQKESIELWKIANKKELKEKIKF
jgi:hypothetical protein